MERQLLIGLINSTEFIEYVKPIWRMEFIESSSAKLLAKWVFEYYQQYNAAPKSNLHNLFFAKINNGMDEELVADVEDLVLGFEEEIVSDLAQLKDLTEAFFKRAYLLQTAAKITDYLETDSIMKAVEKSEALLNELSLPEADKDTSTLTFSPEEVKRISLSFAGVQEPILRYPKQMGIFINYQLTAGAFVAFLAPEKRGKTYLLMDMAIRAVRQGKKVAFWQVGDMNEAEQLKRISAYLTKINTNPIYCAEHYQSTRDCIRNQMNECNDPQREVDFGIFEDLKEDEIRHLRQAKLIDCFEDYPEYQPCYNCKAYQTGKLGVPYLKKIPKKDYLEDEEAVRAIYEFSKKFPNKLKLETRPAFTVSVNDIFVKSDKWARQGFTADIIIVDYADLLRPESNKEFRHQQNQIWGDLRRLSQTPRNNVLPLVITATQADAASYKAFRLDLSNFSEDKRKFGHVTAMYGLNQSPDGREKELGLLRVNEIIIREGKSSNVNEVILVQNLNQGRPIQESFFPF